MFITIMVSALTILFNLACVFNAPQLEPAQETVETFTGFFQVLMFPLLYLFIGLFVTAVLKIMESSRYADLYYEFHEFERYLNKACSTMP